MIAFACSGCNQRLQVGDDLAGKAAKCPRCARVLRVPAPAAPAPPSETATLPPAGHEADTDATIGQAQRTPSQPVRPVNADVPAELADYPRYRVLALLGRGGMGAVCKAEHRRMERLVALKVISPVHLLRCKVHGNPGGCGLALVGDKSRVTLKECDVADNFYQGVWVGGTAQVTARKCRIHDQKRNGVFVDEHARITLEDCEVVGNGWNGIECADGGIAIVRGGAVNRNLDHGLSAGGRASITAEGCAVRGNAKGARHTEGGGKILLTPPG